MVQIREFPHRVGKRTGSFFSEFWKFAAKGNIFDLAIAVVVGNAFTAVVNGLVTDVITPFLSIFTNSVDFTEWQYTIREAMVIAGREAAPITINYGHLLQVTINFLIVGITIFVFYKIFSTIRHRLERTESEEPATPISTQEKLLCEIRDILKEQKREPHNQ